MLLYQYYEFGLSLTDRDDNRMELLMLAFCLQLIRFLNEVSFPFLPFSPDRIEVHM